ncbi:winged helix-turn-helix domain-containing protein [Escherichia coli]|nr:winged helix-turn-helix domain-containing protein [Escherichia coli]EKE4262207.1 winged helix-turn-helix domain-containing protein [Escherichia coli]
MYYTINNSINFRPSDGLIWHLQGSESSITLTTTTSRLLAFLLEHKGAVLSRDEILARVWDAHGLRSSNNSLNKYVSDLRHVFRNMGCQEEILITVPRIGFMLSEYVVVEKHIISPEPLQRPIIQTEKKRHVTESRIFYIFAGMSLMFVILILGLNERVLVNKNDIEPIHQKIWSMAKINNCQVFTFKPLASGTEQLTLDIVKDIINSESISCASDSVVYFQASDQIYHGYSGRVFLSICKNIDHKQTYISSCHNFYETDYEVREG